MIENTSDYLKTFWEDHNDWWYDFAVWLTDRRSSELAVYTIALFFSCLASVLLLLVMLWSRPRLALERALAFRELFLMLTLAQTVIIATLHQTNLYLRVVTYAGLAVSAITCVVFLILERIKDNAEIEEYVNEKYD